MLLKSPTIEERFLCVFVFLMLLVTVNKTILGYPTDMSRSSRVLQQNVCASCEELFELKSKGKMLAAQGLGDCRWRCWSNSHTMVVACHGLG